MKLKTRLILGMFWLSLASCGGGGGGNTGSHSISGNITGLNGGSVVLQNNGGGNLTIAANGNFTFATTVAQGSAYSVAVFAQTFGQNCTVTNGTGMIGTADVTNVAITCAALPSNTTGLYLFAGDFGGLTGKVDDIGAAARFNDTVAIATDSSGNVYVVDYVNASIRKITPLGIVSTLADGSALSGGGYVAALPSSIATDSAGNVYVTLDDNTIRMIDASGHVTTLAGSAGVTGSSDGISGLPLTASFNQPSGIAIDSTGNIYVADSGNNTIRKITSAGVVSTLAGTAGVTGSADNTGATASFNVPAGIATDSAGNVYVADMLNNTIRKITPAGVVTTLAGTAGVTGSADATGAAASFRNPFAVAVDSSANIYVADSNNLTIRKITPVGVVSTVVGVAGQAGGFLPGALPGNLTLPYGVAISGTSLYILGYSGVAVVTNVP